MQIKGRIGDQSDAALEQLCSHLRNWDNAQQGAKGIAPPKLHLGGIGTDGLSSKTMEAKAIKGLYVIGEAMDVTGWLGGYNFQWAWSSGWAAGTAIAQRKARLSGLGFSVCPSTAITCPETILAPSPAKNTAIFAMSSALTNAAHESATWHSPYRPHRASCLLLWPRG